MLTPLQPLPIPERPNWRIHADLFGPMLTADSNKKFVLCITDAFTKYAEVTSIQNKNAETVADAIFKEWFCKFRIPAQIHTDGGKEFVNKLTVEMMELMNVSHTRMSPAHPQCNSQVEVFNKTVKKYLASFVDNTALNWETYLPALALSYNTSYHSTIATTPFELLFGEKARLPSFPNEDIQKVHYGETTAAERFNLLQKLRKIAHENATSRISETMPLHSENCWEGCPTNCGKSLKSGRRFSGHLPTLIFIIYSRLKMSSGSTVPDPDPELINAQNFNFEKPKLFFKNIGKYATTSTYIYIRIPFNFTTVFNTKQAIAKVYDQLLDKHKEHSDQ
jgi:Integrase core domain